MTMHSVANKDAKGVMLTLEINGITYIEAKEYDALIRVLAAAIVREGGRIFLSKGMLDTLPKDFKIVSDVYPGHGITYTIKYP